MFLSTLHSRLDCLSCVRALSTLPSFGEQTCSRRSASQWSVGHLHYCYIPTEYLLKCNADVIASASGMCHEPCATSADEVLAVAAGSGHADTLPQQNTQIFLCAREVLS